MTPERYQRIGQLFDEALDQPSERRQRWLHEACGSDHLLRQQVETLIANQPDAQDFLARPALELAAELLARNQTQTLSGTTLGHYKLGSLLGVGGMGEVYLAEDTHLGRNVALKVLAPELRDKSEQLSRLEQEARAASALNHPNILTIYEIGDVDGIHFIAAEYVAGETLRTLMSRERPAVDEALRIAEQIAAALEAAHRVGIIHRDVKPENIVVRVDGLVKLLDFGIAKLSEPSPRKIDDEAFTHQFVKTNPGTVLGTIGYMPPEQVRLQSLDVRADVWSLGVTVYEMLTGRLPFAEDSVNDTIASILTSEPASPSEYNSEIPEELDRIVLKALRKNPDERYQHAGDLLSELQDLRASLEFESKLKRSRSASEFLSSKRDTFRSSSSGIQPTASSLPPKSEWRFKVFTGLLLLVVMSAGVYFFINYRRRLNSGSVAIDSIAVMPFTSPTSDAATEYLRDGLADSLIISLSRLPQLRVMARATMFRYKGREVDPQVAGNEVGVKAVLTGRIVQQADGLIISAELVSVVDGRQLWGERYNASATDLLATQQDIARQISQHLQLRLSGEQERKLNTGSTTNSEAYELYLRGRYSWNKRTAEDIRKAIESFQQAIALDPRYALAYVGLADCYIIQGAFAGTPTTDILPQANTAIEKALELDSSIAEAHASKGFLHLYAMQWNEAEAEFKRAVALNPNYATAHHWYSEYFRIQRRFPEQLREIKRAQELDPLSPSMGANLGRAYLNLGETDNAIRECKRSLGLNPSFSLAHHFLGLTYVEQHRYDEAIAEFQQAVSSSKRSDLFLAGLGAGYASAGNRKEALLLVEELKEKYARKEATGFDLALVESALGDSDEAISWLRKDFDGGNMSGLMYVGSTIIHQRLHNDSRYQDLLREMHLPSN